MAISLFDANFYRTVNSDLVSFTDAQAQAHFQQWGLNEGRQFSPFVNLNFYRASNADLASFNNRQLFDHLQTYGVREERRFSEFVDLNFYRSLSPDLSAFRGEQLFEHLRQWGVNEGRRMSQFVDLGVYRSRNADLSHFSLLEALTHLEVFGLNEGRQFSTAFDVNYYRSLNPDLSEIGFNNLQLLQHFETYGVDEGRISATGFNGRVYLANNADLSAIGFSYRQAFQHFVTYGYGEGRSGSDYAGNTMSTARGNANTPLDFVGVGDTDDFYRFAINISSTFEASITGLSANANLRLLNSRGEEVQATNSGGRNSATIGLFLNPGTYYLQVSLPSATEGTYYTLSSGITLPNPIASTGGASGNLAIDALLASNYAYWNTRANDGIITYSFYQSSSGHYSGSEIVSEVSQAIKANVRQILGTVESLINVRFIEVVDTVDHAGVLRYMFSNGPDYAYAKYPASGTGGDVHLNPSDDSSFSSGYGSYGYMALIHETLHALGLKHPGNYNGSNAGNPPFLPGGEDNMTNTVMTYNNAVGSSAIEPMPYDIRALQYLYGAKPAHPSDTTYNFSSVTGYEAESQFFGSTLTRLKQTLLDTSGVDILNFSNVSTSENYYLDLRAGGILTTQSAYNASRYTARGEGVSYSTSSYGTSIAYNTVIENLINSHSNDTIIANSANNVFKGYAVGTFTGNDTIELSTGSDVLELAGYNLTGLTTTITGTDLTISLGSSGTVQIKDYYGANGSMKIWVNGTYYTYRASGGWQATSASG